MDRNPRLRKVKGAGADREVLGCGSLECPAIELGLYHVSAGEPGIAREQGLRSLPCHPPGNVVEGAKHSLQLEARTSPLATESGRTTETRPERSERSPRRGGLERRAGPIVTWAAARRRDFRRRRVFFPVVGSHRPSLTGPCDPRPPRPPRPPAAGPAAAMKKFFQEIKSDIKFKSAGPGQKLTESAGCVTGAGA